MLKNSQLNLANDFVQFTGQHIFLTGKAGTGKTTFLHTLKEKSPKRMIVVAPTGVAAINAGGVTIHSFFQLPFGPNVPGISGNEAQQYRKFSREKRNIMKSLDLLVIDEISMVRADLLDGVDETLRRFRNNSHPFGGVQLLMIGDMQQLAPVIKDDERNILRKHYSTAFFFGSIALKKTSYTSIELKHVYRQSDQHFIDLLNKIRENKIDNEVIQLLNERYKPDFNPVDEDYIILTTHNARAKDVNDSKLKLLKGKSSQFNAEISGKFPEYTFPTETNLEFKIGAQVMFVKNDPEPEKRFYNGKIGKIIELRENTVVVQCKGDSEPIDVTSIEWQNMKYAIDEESSEIKETVEGTFTQIPLKLAWAITIHKSQGLTFDRAIIDSARAFAYGQVYVALSRCRSLEGLVLSSPFSPGSLKNDHTIESFNKDVEANQPDQQSLDQSRKAYQKDLLLDLFDFSAIQKSYYRFHKVLQENQKSIQPGIADQFKKGIPLINHDIVDVSSKFKNQIKILLQSEDKAEDNAELQDRLRKGTQYFINEIQKNISSILTDYSTETDNKEVLKIIGKAEESMHENVNFKLACLDACKTGFKVEDYLDDRAKASMEKPKKKRSLKKKKPMVSKDINNPELYELLKEWRDAKSVELNLPYFMILPVKTMRALSNQVPTDMESLKMVHGFGKRKLDHFGSELLGLLNDFKQDHDVVIKIEEESELPESAPKKNTKEISFELWKEFKDISRVAVEREMAITTIEGHLAHYIETGELPVSEVVSAEKLTRLIAFYGRHEEELTLNEAKAKLGQQISYRDLKFVQAHLDQNKKDINLS